MLLATETKLPEIEGLVPKPSVEQINDHEEVSNPENDAPIEVSYDNSNVCFTSTTKQLLFAILD